MTKHDQLATQPKFKLINMNLHSKAQSKDREAITYLNADRLGSETIISKFFPFEWPPKSTIFSK